MSGQGVCVLYSWPGAWGLPSLSPACIQAEAYLRLCGADFSVEVCTTNGNSPTGQLPALERDAFITPAESDEFTSAAAIIAYAKKHVKDLDAHLSLGQRADLLAFSALLDRLNVASTLTTWCEPRGFAELKKAAFAGKLPFPLSQVIPWSRQREVRQRLPQHADMAQVYAAAGEALHAVADRLRAGGSAFFFGPQPSSMDALLLGHLLYLRSSPAVAPVLQEQVTSQPVLCEYVDRLMAAHFAAPATPRAALEAGPGGAALPGWSDAAKGAKKAPKVEPTAAELTFRRHSLYWVLGAGAAVLSYVLLSGKYIQFATLMEQAGDEGDEEDDDEDEPDE